MAERVAIYPGTFDPITNGHLDIVKRGAHLFDRVLLAVSEHGQKQTIFTFDERIALAREVTAELPHVVVAGFSGLLIECAREQGISIVLRGMRAITDFDYEFQMAGMNRQLYPEMETLFLASSLEHCYLSSTMVKEIASLQGDVTAFVPSPVADALASLYAP